MQFFSKTEKVHLLLRMMLDMFSPKDMLKILLKMSVKMNHVSQGIKNFRRNRRREKLLVFEIRLGPKQ
jgi:hypothetical protein